MVVWITVGVVVVMLAGLLAYLAWRDRRRMSSADDSSASRAASADAERFAADRHGHQGVNWQQGSMHGP
jgi:hypothetical protein